MLLKMYYNVLQCITMYYKWTRAPEWIWEKQIFNFFSNNNILTLFQKIAFSIKSAIFVSEKKSGILGVKQCLSDTLVSHTNYNTMSSATGLKNTPPNWAESEEICNFFFDKFSSFLGGLLVWDIYNFLRRKITANNVFAGLKRTSFSIFF